MQEQNLEKRTIIIDENGNSVILSAIAQNEEDLNITMGILTREIFE